MLDRFANAAGVRRTAHFIDERGSQGETSAKVPAWRFFRNSRCAAAMSSRGKTLASRGLISPRSIDCLRANGSDGIVIARKDAVASERPHGVHLLPAGDGGDQCHRDSSPLNRGSCRSARRPCTQLPRPCRNRPSCPRAPCRGAGPGHEARNAGRRWRSRPRRETAGK